MNFEDIDIKDLQLDHSIDVNPSTGSATGSVGVPLPEGRSGLTPALSLSYRSSSRNSSFGIGWNLDGLSFISIDTQNGVPRYDGSDTFSFNGSNALVPQLDDANRQRVDQNPEFWIYYFRSEYEDAFIRFEKWVHKATGRTHWRSRTKNDVLSIYGRDTSGLSRVFNSEKPDDVFIWLLEAQYDTSGNAILYRYKAENAEGVNPTLPFEKDRIRRFQSTGFAQRYPSKILYGNTKALRPDETVPVQNRWLFEVCFDYGEYFGNSYDSSQIPADSTWLTREDPFSVYNAGFEIRSYRLCRRLLIYHHFEELNSAGSLTGVLNLSYDSRPFGSSLQAVSWTGVRRDLETGDYSTKKLPELTFEYSRPEPGSVFHGITEETHENLPQGFNPVTSRYIDLLSEGLPGVLTETSDAWYYKSNLGNGRFGRQEIVVNRPSRLSGAFSIGDFDRDGNIDLFSLEGRTAGFYEYDRNREEWSGFRPFENLPRGGKPKIMDINGDGYPDLIIESEEQVTVYPFRGKEGADRSYQFSRPGREGSSSAPVIGEDRSLKYFLADMTGDGMADQVRVQNGRVEYFPNLGNGQFGEKVVMVNSPVIDFDASFDVRKLRLYDLNGTGTADIIYLGNGEIKYWYNVSGNQFVEGATITGVPYIDEIESVSILDFLGNGTPCLVWSSSRSHYSSVRYLQLTNGIKPRLLISMKNSMGREVRIDYGHSGSHYLEAKQRGQPWITKIPSHFTVVDKKTVIDHITGSAFTTVYRYRDGHFNGITRRFVTFGLVEQVDTEVFTDSDHTPGTEYSQPFCLKTWFHNGMFGWDARRVSQYYDRDDRQRLLPSHSFGSDKAYTSNEFERACRSLAGKVLRQETFALGPEETLEEHPFHIIQNSYGIRKIQPATNKHNASFFTWKTETLIYNYEAQPGDPQVNHHLSTGLDDYGSVTGEMSISYARRSDAPDLHTAQKRDYITLNRYSFSNTDTADSYFVGIPVESRKYEVNHLEHTQDDIVRYSEVSGAVEHLITSALQFDQKLPDSGEPKARLIYRDRIRYWNDSGTDQLPVGEAGQMALVHHEETACFTDALLADIYSDKVDETMVTGEGGYQKDDGYWWQQTAVNHYEGIGGFFNLKQTDDGAGGVTRYSYDPYYLHITETTDPAGNVTRAEIDYNRGTAYRVTDPNRNISEVLYDALGVIHARFHQGTLLATSDSTVHAYGSGQLKEYTVPADVDFDTILAEPEMYLQQADYVLFYDLDCWKIDGVPLRSMTLNRENLLYDGEGNRDDTISCQLGLAYMDGFGRPVQEKTKVGPGPAVKRASSGDVEMTPGGEPVLEGAADRWLVSGHVVYNSKQQAVRQYEPFFSTMATYEADSILQSWGVSAQFHYDALDRVIRTDFPNATFSETKFSPWEVRSFDENDTVERSMYKAFREILPEDDPEKRALNHALSHKETPSVVKMDPYGRAVSTVHINNDGTQRTIENSLDSQGNLISVTDARGIEAFNYKLDMQGRTLFEMSVDAGESWVFYDQLDREVHKWDGKGHRVTSRYDGSGRVTSTRVQQVSGEEHVSELFVYGEDDSLSHTEERNLRGRLVRHYDQAGVRQVEAFAPDGQPISTSRKLVQSYTEEPDWEDPGQVELQAVSYTSRFVYDALGRSTVQHLPDQTSRTAVYGKGGEIISVRVSTEDGELADEEILKDASCDAKGMRQQMILGNGARVDYSYDPETFRLSRLLTRRTEGTARTWQDLNYTYDPAGNLIHVVDKAQQPEGVNSHVLEGLNASSHSEFTYDALYQLTSASGRVHQALQQQDVADRSRESGVPGNWAKGTRHILLDNGAAVERYSRGYEYDLAGNLKKMTHTGGTHSWTRNYWIAPASNRSLPLQNPDTDAGNLENRFDANGNCTSLPHLESLHWSYRNTITRAVVIDRSDGGKPSDEEFYIYDGDGMRVRKITHRVVDVANEVIEKTEKIYLDGCEIKIISRGDLEVLKSSVSRISDGKSDLARIYSWVSDSQARETDDVSEKKIHYQLGNHLGSSSLELDEEGRVITYEEYFPFGGTSFIAGRSRREIKLKTCRYSGKERDDFTGLYYFGYRYYAHWIGGWLSPDPIGPEDSVNLYLYVQNNPINLVDPNGLESNSVHIRMLSTPAALPQEIRDNMAANGSGHGYFMGGAEERYDYTLEEMIDLAGETGNTIQLYDRHAAALFFRFMSDSSDENYENYRSLMYATKDALEEQFGVDIVLEWHDIQSIELPSAEEEEDGSQEEEGPNSPVGKENGNESDPDKEKSSESGGGKGKERTSQSDSNRSGQGSKKASGDSVDGGKGKKGGHSDGREGGSLRGSPEGQADGQDGGALPGTDTGTDGIKNDTGSHQPGGGETGEPGQGGHLEGDPKRGGGEGKVDWGSPAGGNPDITDEEPAWWQRGLMAMAGAVTSVANIFIEAGKQLYDMAGLLTQSIGIATGWYDYEHDVASAIGHAAQSGQGTLDIFANMGRGIVEAPGRAWSAAESGDWYGFGSESMNVYMIGRGGYSLARGSASFAFNRSVAATGAAGTSLVSKFGGSTTRMGTGLTRLGQKGIGLRSSIRDWQTQRLGARINRKLDLPDEIQWQYGGTSSKFGTYKFRPNQPGKGKIIIYEKSFTPSLLHRLPTKGPYARNTRLGISRMLRGRSSHTTPLHEGWHAYQHIHQINWVKSIVKNRPTYSKNPAEFTQGPQPLMGAHNYAFRFAMPSDFSLAFGLGSAGNNVLSD